MREIYFEGDQGYDRRASPLPFGVSAAWRSAAAYVGRAGLSPVVEGYDGPITIAHGGDATTRPEKAKTPTAKLEVPTTVGKHLGELVVTPAVEADAVAEPSPTDEPPAEEPAVDVPPVRELVHV